MKLPPEIRSLCSRIALERTRPAVMQCAGEMRRDTERQLKAGMAPADVQAWLQGLLGDALKAQA